MHLGKGTRSMTAAVMGFLSLRATGGDTAPARRILPCRADAALFHSDEFLRGTGPATHQTPNGPLNCWEG